MGSTCSGTPLYEISAWGPSAQAVVFGSGGQAYAYDMSATAVTVDVSDTAVRALHAGCSAPQPLSYWIGGSGTVSLWPLTPTAARQILSGP